MTRRTTRLPRLSLGLVWIGGVLAPSAPVKPPGQSDLLDARLGAARAAYQQFAELHRTDRANAEYVYRWSRRWLDAQLALSTALQGNAILQ